MLDKRPNLVDAVNVMFPGAVTESTSAQYNAIVSEFFQFCKNKKADFPNFSAATVLEFIAVHNVVNEVRLFNNALYPNSLVYTVSK